MPQSRRRQIWQRAGGCCEYCRMPPSQDVRPFQVDHVRAKKHGGTNTASNLCLACLPCNSGKGSNIAGIDPVTQSLQPLYNPRDDAWDEHFAWEGPRLAGRTPVGRATIEVLNINQADRVEHRLLLIALGEFHLDDA
jgi:hypothetical protein